MGRMRVVTSTVVSLSMAWSLCPTAALGEPGEQPAAQQEGAAIEQSLDAAAPDAAAQDAATVNEGVETPASTEVATDITSAPAAQEGSEAAAETTDTSSSASADATSQPEETVVPAPADTATATSDDASSATQAAETQGAAVETGSAASAEATKAADADVKDEAKDDKDTAKGESEDAAKAEEEKAAVELLSDEELSALAVELPADEVAVLEEGDIALHAQAASGWSRVAGETALDTMQRVLQIGAFASERGGAVIIASAGGYWDALAAAGLAGTLKAPVVLTSGSALSDQARAEVARLKPERIIVAGGDSTISNGVLDELRTLAPTVERSSGALATDTAVDMYHRGTGWGRTAVVAASSGYWDALSVAPYAYWAKAPIFLAGGDGRLGDPALQAIAAGGFERVVIAGGDSSVSNDVEGQLAGIGVGEVVRKKGPDAIMTSAEVANFEVAEGMSLKNLMVASSGGYWDALAAAPVAGELGSVLVLVGSTGDYRALDAVYSYQPGTVDHGYIVGGTDSVPKKIEERVVADWALKSYEVTANTVRAGSEVTGTPVVETGGRDIEEFSYNYVWSRNGSWDAGESDSDVKDGQGAVKDKSRTYTLSRPGHYDLYVDVYGPDGTKQTIGRTVDAYALQDLGISAISKREWKLTADVGVPGNKVPGVEYRFTWQRDGSDVTGVIRDWSGDPNATVSLSSMQGSFHTYTVTVEVRDGGGSLGTRSQSIRPSLSHDIAWAGQPNNYYCGPTSGFMVLRNLGANNSAADGAGLTIGNVASAMGTSYYGYTSFSDRMFEHGMNAWLGKPAYATVDNPSYDQVREAIFRSFDTGYPVVFDAHEVSGGRHYNGHSDGTFSHIIVVDAYDPSNDAVLMCDPGAGVLWGGAAQKFWYPSLRDFVNTFLAPAAWRDGIGMIYPR